MEFIFPQSNKSGTRMNSKMFIVATMMICDKAFKRFLIPLKIQPAIPTSENPINKVKGLA